MGVALAPEKRTGGYAAHLPAPVLTGTTKGWGAGHPIGGAQSGRYACLEVFG
jgi:hypothetical protein